MDGNAQHQLEESLKVAMSRENLNALHMFYEETKRAIDSLNTRLASGLAVVPALSAFAIFDDAETIRAAIESLHPSALTILLMCIAGVAFIGIGIVLLFQGLKAKSTQSPFNLERLKLQCTSEYADIEKFLQQQIANFAGYIPNYLEMAEFKGKKFNSGVTWALNGFALIVILRLFLSLFGGMNAP